MRAELRHPVLKRRKRAHTYFVGRREFGGPAQAGLRAGLRRRLEMGSPGKPIRETQLTRVSHARILVCSPAREPFR
jgi:hypothetical protein